MGKQRRPPPGCFFYGYMDRYGYKNVQDFSVIFLSCVCVPPYVNCEVVGLCRLQIRRLLQLPRVPVHLVHDVLDGHDFAVEVHFLAVLW